MKIKNSIAYIIFFGALCAPPLFAGDAGLIEPDDGADASLTIPVGDEAFDDEFLSGECGMKEAIPESILRDVLASPDFGEETKTWILRFKDTKKNQKTDDEISWRERFRKIGAYFLRAFIVIAIAALIFVLIFFIMRMKKDFFHSKNTKTAVFAPHKKESPEALLREALVLYEHGSKRDAWAKCFCAVLGAFAYKNIIFSGDATEYECLKTVAAKQGELAGAFKEIVGNWVRVAYAHADVSEDSFYGAVSFCKMLFKPEAA